MSSQNDDYNGWTNRATWVVNLWISNDEPSYRRSLFIDNVDDAEFFVKSQIDDTIRDGIISDWAGYWSWDDVNWKELVEAWQE